MHLSVEEFAILFPPPVAAVNAIVEIVVPPDLPAAVVDIPNPPTPVHGAVVELLPDSPAAASVFEEMDIPNPATPVYAAVVVVPPDFSEHYSNNSPDNRVPAICPVQQRVPCFDDDLPPSSFRKYRNRDRINGVERAIDLDIDWSPSSTDLQSVDTVYQPRMFINQKRSRNNRIVLDSEDDVSVLTDTFMLKASILPLSNLVQPTDDDLYGELNYESDYEVYIVNSFKQTFLKLPPVFVYIST